MVRKRRVEPEPDDPRPTLASASAWRGYIRKLRSGEIDQPALARAWNCGAALMRLTERRWANPVVMLFVCGYYGHVAHLLLRTPDEGLRRRRLAAMAEALPSVPFHSAGYEIDDVKREQLNFEGFNRWMVEATANGDSQLEKREDRVLWSINVRSHAAFVTVWNSIAARGLDMRNPVIATAQFITERAQYDLGERDAIVCNLIRDALTPPSRQEA